VGSRRSDARRQRAPPHHSRTTTGRHSEVPLGTTKNSGLNGTLTARYMTRIATPHKGEAQILTERAAPVERVTTTFESLLPR
jgi:hypothetical protein